MSRDVGVIKNAGVDDRVMIITAFYGGREKGVCFQLTEDSAEFHYVTLTPKDLITLNHIIGKHLSKGTEVDDE